LWNGAAARSLTSKKEEPMLDRSFIGKTGAPVVHDVEAGHIRRFAEAIGDPDPIYRDDAAARAAGHPAIPAPPTFPTALRPEDPRAGLDIDFRKVLHGEQSFWYERPLYAGDRVQVIARIADIYKKAGKSGAMDFVVVETEGRDLAGALLYRARSVTVVRR
jgi:acyl dehydratase